MKKLSSLFGGLNFCFLLFGCGFLDCFICSHFSHDFYPAEVDAVDTECRSVDCRNGEEGHNVGRHAEARAGEEEPVVVVVSVAACISGIVSKVAEGRPNRKDREEDQGLVAVLELWGEFAGCESADRPCQENTVENEGLEYLVAEGRDLTYCAAGIYDVHNRRRCCKKRYGLCEFFKFLVELNKCGNRTKNGAEVEGKLVDVHREVARNEGLKEYIRNVNDNERVSERAKHRFRFIGVLSNVEGKSYRKS